MSIKSDRWIRRMAAQGMIEPFEAGQVRTAGYDVVAARTALGSYSVSRIYYTGGHRADAEAFKDRFPAFSVVEPAPANLSRRVALHVVIGKDYPGV